MVAIHPSGPSFRATYVRQDRRLASSRRLLKPAARARSRKRTQTGSNPQQSMPIGIPGDPDRLQVPEGDYRMPLMQIVLTLIVVGVLLWLINRFIPMQSTIKSILNGLVTIVVVLWILNLAGLFHYLNH